MGVPYMSAFMRKIPGTVYTKLFEMVDNYDKILFTSLHLPWIGHFIGGLGLLEGRQVWRQLWCVLW